MSARRSWRRRRQSQRGVALLLVLTGLSVLGIMLWDFKLESSAQFSSAIASRDRLKAEFAAKSAVNLSRLLIASEPTIRKALAPLFLLMRRGPPQIPVWEFADQVLGAFNDKDGGERFQQLASVRLEDGEKLGLEGAGFVVKIVDEDAKINVNTPARGDAFSQQRLAAALASLIGSPEYNAMFENRDVDGNFSDRETICAAIIDWTDPDSNQAVCAPQSETARATGAEDSYYSLLKDPYQRKNAAFDSLEELRLVRGIGDDFWATFVEPSPGDHEKRTLTVWGQGKVNVNTANAQTIWALVCAGAVPETPMCPASPLFNPEEAGKFISALTLMRNFTAGAPIFSSPKGFINSMGGKGMFGTVMGMLELQPIRFLSSSEFQKIISTESKVFSIVADGYVKYGKRETHVRIHSVVDFQKAPPPGMAPLPGMTLPDGVNIPGIQNPAAGASPIGLGPPANLPDGATEDAIAAAFQARPGGRYLYYRME